MSTKIKKFANILVNYSTNIKKNDLVIISATTSAEPLILELYKQILKKGAYPRTNIILPKMNYIYFKNTSIKQIKHFPEISYIEAKKANVYISIISETNTKELTNIDPKKISLRHKILKPIQDQIVNSKTTRRVTTLFPTPSLAQEAEMSTEEYEEFVYSSIIQDWKKLSKQYQKYKKLFKNKNKIRIIGKETDIEMSIKNRPIILDTGKENMPGGEMFLAPLEKTVNGYIKFTYPALFSGKEITDIYLEFKNGKVVKAKASKNQEFLNKIINTDKGSKYIGELGIGLNKKINKFTKNTLFDEKINSTIHLALGMSYKECKGTNNSAIHWDIIKDLKQGQIILDNETIQKNGKFII